MVEALQSIVQIGRLAVNLMLSWAKTLLKRIWRISVEMLFTLDLLFLLQVWKIT